MARGTRRPKVRLDELTRRVGPPRSTVRTYYLTGETLAPVDVLDRMVIALGASAVGRQAWDEAW